MKTIIVTGCNKGIGYGIVEKLMEQQYKIIMGCRNIQLAEQAKQSLICSNSQSKSELHVMKCDLGSKQGIEDFVSEFGSKFEKVDILLNNAGILDEQFSSETVQKTFQTNFWGTKQLTESMLELMNKSGKIINICSMLGSYSMNIDNDKLRDRFEQGECLEQLYIEYLQGVSNGDYEQIGWKRITGVKDRSIYSASKLFLNVYSQRLGQNQSILQRDIQVYSCCPGWINTQMGGPDAPGTIQDGVQTPLFLLSLPFTINHILQGQFFQSSNLSTFK